MLNVAVQMDPIEKINDRRRFHLRADAGGAGARARAVLLHAGPLSLRDDKVLADVAPVEVRDIEGDHFTLGDAKRDDLADSRRRADAAGPALRHGLHHRDASARAHPPEDPRRQRSGAACATRRKKSSSREFPAADAADADHARQGARSSAFREEHGDIVMKPLYGNGGAACSRSRKTTRIRLAFDCSSATFREPWVVQRFLPEVRRATSASSSSTARRRGAVNRVPAENDIRSNMVRGGAAARPSSRRARRNLARRSGRSCKRRGLIFVGIDVIDGNLTEINVTSPTGIRAIANARRAGHRRDDLGCDREEARHLTCRVLPPTPPGCSPNTISSSASMRRRNAGSRQSKCCFRMMTRPK